MRIVVVAAEFNREIVDLMRAHAARAFAEISLKPEQVDVIRVFGALEIPAMIQKAIDTKKYDGAMALGCVIRGETDHYDYVCQGVTYGMQKVAIENRFPIMFSVLTVQDEAQARARAGNAYEHAKALISMITVYKQLS